MNNITRKLFATIMIIFIALNLSSTALAEYDTSKVSTTLNGIRYYMDGAKLMSEGKEVVDFRSLTYKDSKADLNKEVMKTLLITDLASNEWLQYPIIYAVGMVFKNEQDDPNDTSSYKYMKLRLGKPYIVVLSYNLSKTEEIAWYSQDIMLEAYIPLSDIWDYPYNTEVIDDPDQPEVWKTLYKYSARVVQPRIIMSKYEKQTAYILAPDLPDKNVPKEHVKLFKFRTSKNLKPEEKFRPEMYATLEWFSQEGKKYGKYEPRLDRFYIKEQTKQNITLYNFGDEISVAVDCDITEYTKPKFNIYWQYTKDLNIQ
ncbi:MAG: hypothetical protein BWY74_00660 [Firmicutes bacterium ADurb.Bin419]|nr:MAG: hypothetical protein BWY74_00660 [Firmicutes bacterium ADurb.Bin419]